MINLLENIPVSPLLQKFIGVAAIIVGTIFVAFLVRYIISGIGLRIAARTKTELDDKLLAAANRLLFLLVLLFGLSVLLNYLESILVETLGLKLFEVFDGVLYALGVLLVATTVVRVLSVTFRWYGSAVAARTETQLDDEFVPLLDRAVKVIIYVLAILIILDHFSVDIKGLITVLGVGSLAIALAAQETIANMIGGFVIMVDRPFRVGDWLRLSDGTTCRVHQIGVRSTKFLTFENTLIIIPNAELMKSTVHNITYPYPESRVRIDVGVSYESDMTLVRQVMLDEASKHPQVLSEPAPFFRFLEFADSSLNVSMFCRVPDVLDQWLVGSELRQQILERFRKEGIEIPFPQRVVTMIEPEKRREPGQ
ncbi:MAG: mechanosensitive ion channel family protein [Candidatus Zixiibacteriota bacterium]|nr:MAG: mechanosensitive ion channel family protein [candidate division Zixibacteria bacterium]